MDKFLNAILETLFWLLIFLCPVLIFGIVAAVIYFSNPENTIGAWCVFFAGMCTGIAWAEWARRKYGFSDYWNSLSSTSSLKEKGK